MKKLWRRIKKCMLACAMATKDSLLAACTLLCVSFSCAAQTAPPASPSIQDRLQRMMDSSSGAWTPDQLATMAKLRDAPMQDQYALKELHHLTDNIGPRLAGSPQAQKAVEYVAAEMKALGADVQLEKTTVPHWVRGAEEARLV